MAVYMAPGSQQGGRVVSEGKFVHVPWEGLAQSIDKPNEYRDFPIVAEDCRLRRTVIVWINGAADGLLAGLQCEDNYVITEDHYISYMSGSAEEVVPAQILAKLRKSNYLFLGYTIADWRLRVFLKRIWKGPGLGRAQYWAVEHDPDPLEEDLWRQINVRLHQSSLADYLRGFHHSSASIQRNTVMTDQKAEVEPRECPYIGLDYYQERFGAWFFGREAEGDKILTNLQAARLTLLHAESGAGKSSLLRAGVAWRLRRLARAGPSSGAAVDLPVVFSSWKDDPVAGPDRASWAWPPSGRVIRHRACRPTGLTTRSRPWRTPRTPACSSFSTSSRSIFSTAPVSPPRSVSPMSWRTASTRTDVPANFLISIREDAYAGLGDLFKGRITNVYGNFLHIDYLGRQAAEQAIRAPLEVYNRQPGVAERVTIQDGLVDAVLDQVRAYDVGRDSIQGQAAANGRAERFATPLLQLAMETLWRRELAQESHELRLETLQGLEGVERSSTPTSGRRFVRWTSGERRDRDRRIRLPGDALWRQDRRIPSPIWRTGPLRAKTRLAPSLASWTTRGSCALFPRRPGRTRCGSAAMRSSTTCSPRRSTMSSPSARNSAAPGGCGASAH